MTDPTPEELIAEVRADAARFKIAGHELFAIRSRHLDALLAAVDERDALRSDERHEAWERVAAHPFFAECYGHGRPLIETMIEKLDAAEKPHPRYRHSHPFGEEPRLKRCRACRELMRRIADARS